MPTIEVEESGEWEICRDYHFVYKRRRRNDVDEPSASAYEEPAAKNEVPVTEIRRQCRARTRGCLVGLREKYKREIQHWEQLSSSIVLSDPQPVRTANDFMENRESHKSVTELKDSRLQSIDELLAQVENQQDNLNRINDICDEIDAQCSKKEEELARYFLDLPIWGSPRTLLKSLSN